MNIIKVYNDKLGRGIQMKKNGILNRHVNEIIASMGHGQVLIICDAGFPIPRDANYVDLAVMKDLPRLETILELIANEFITEKVMVANEVPTNNPHLYAEVKKLFPECEIETVKHEEMLGHIAHNAKAIIRTGAYNPWGNIALVSGTDPFAWFDSDDYVIPEFYQERIKRINEANKK